MTVPWPSVGRIVHYRSYGTPVLADGSQTYPPACRAAIITEVTNCGAHAYCVGLFVANPNGVFLKEHVPYDGTSQQQGGTWHWPERM